MERFDGLPAQVSFLVLDLLLTAAVFGGVWTLLNFGGQVASGGLPATDLIDPSSWIDQMTFMASFIYDRFILEQSPGTAMVFSTFFTSVWIWLYVGAGGLLRVLYPVLKGIDWLKENLDVEARPVHTLGLLLAVLTTITFAVSAPFVL
jgi:hypothetical protein